MKKTILMMLLAGSSCAVFAQTDSSRNNGNSNSGTVNGTMSSSTNGSMNSYNSNGSMNSNGSYNAYGTFTATPPNYVQSYVLRDYPTATDVKWQQSADWWHGYYMNNGQPVHTYYNTAGQTFTVALPVHESLVPDAVVSRAISQYGPTLYDVTTVKGSNGQDIYMVRTLENGQITSQWIGEDGTKVIDVYRMDNSGMNTMIGNMNNSSNTNGTQNTPMNSTNQSNASGTDMSNNSSDSGMNGNTNTGKDKLKIKTKSSDGKVHKTKVVNGKLKTKGDGNQ